MSHRPFLLVTGLGLGDYLLWDWSLNANHDITALISGLTLPLLALVWLWLVVVAMTRLLTSRPARARGASRSTRTGSTQAGPPLGRRGARGSVTAEPEQAALSGAKTKPSRKLAA